MSTITIVGATGKVGSKTVHNLLGKGHTLKLVARHMDKLQEYAGKQAVEIHAGNSLDVEFLANVFKGSNVVMLMMPADLHAENIGDFQDKMGKAQIEAVRKSGINKVLFLSSVGGHTEDHTGIVAGLARQEIRLKGLKGVDVLILRPTYFMENLFTNVPLIKNMGINGSSIAADKSFPIIATQDVAKVVAEKLNNLDWSGKTVLPLLGPKDYSMNEVTRALGTAIGKPALNYVQFPYEQAKQAMMQWGISDSAAQAFVGLTEGINIGRFDTEPRNVETSTPTTIEEFSKTFSFVYNQN
jgi:uncharacterized protein YbjT (DUF2867 family)